MDRLARSQHNHLPNGTTSSPGNPTSTNGFSASIKETNKKHSVLSGEQPLFSHHFSAAEMESLTAICDTFVPSFHHENFCAADSSMQREYVGKNEEDELTAFLQLSASQAEVPAYVVGLLKSKSSWSELWLIRWTLSMLSMRLGTFLMFGIGSLSGVFPYFQRFSHAHPHQREQLLLSWSQSRLPAYRKLFKGFKSAILFSMYSKVSTSVVNRNPAWNAIGYCGPDPVATAYRKKLDGNSGQQKPLEGKVLNVNAMEHTDLSSSLRNAGFQIIEDVSHLIDDSWEKCLKETARGRAVGLKCDAVVVGSGSGGGVVAGVLAQAGYKVIVLEKGSYLAREDLSLLEGPSLEHMYEGGGLLSTEDRGVVLQAGSTVGGGSTVNWGASFRTPKHVLEEWSKEQKLGLFTSCEYEKAMEVVCERMGVQERLEEESVPNRVLRDGCRKLGWDAENAPMNSTSDHFCGWCGMGCWNGKKKGTSETWLVDAAAAGAVILAGCKARAVLHRDNLKSLEKTRKAVGVVASMMMKRSGGVSQVEEEEEVMLVIEAAVSIAACGTLHTPTLLRRSGLHNPHIGHHLRLHISTTIWGYFPPGPTVGTRSTYEGCIISSVYRADAVSHRYILQNPAVHPGAFAVMTPWCSGMEHKERMRRFARTATIFALARDVGCGHVDEEGVIHYKLHPMDEENLKLGVEKALRILIAAGATEVGTNHMCGDRLTSVQDAKTADIEAFLQRVRCRQLGNYGTWLVSAHQMGTCRMGVVPQGSVVDPRGETWEVEGLFVADASVFPTALGINPMVTVQSIAYCTAQSVLDFLKQQ